MNLRFFHRVAQQTPTRLWLHNPTDLELELGLAAGAVGCTTDSAYGATLLAHEPQYIQPLLGAAAPTAPSDAAAANAVYMKAALRLLRRFLPLHKNSSGAHGYVTMQIHPAAADDAQALRASAQEWAALAPNCLPMLPPTTAGAAALEYLITKNIPACAACAPSPDHALFLCDLYHRASTASGQRPPFFIAPTILDDSSSTIARQQYHLLKQRGHHCTMLATGIQNPQHFLDMVGGDIHVALTWTTAQALINSNPTVESRIDAAPPAAPINPPAADPAPPHRIALQQGHDQLLAAVSHRRKATNRRQPSPQSAIFGDLTGQIAVVTGGATGIGAAVVRALVALGARVACAYHKSNARADALAEELNTTGPLVFPVQMDVTSAPQIASAVTAIEKHFAGRITILINNAGDLLDAAPIESMSAQLWDQALLLNLTSIFRCSQLCIPGMKAHGWGRIINISSVSARAGGGPGYVHYATCKGGMEAFTRGLAKELAPANITVNTVAPGIINTPIHQRYDAAGNLEAVRSRIPVNKLGTSEEVAAAVAFLASPIASYITGATIPVNGGLRMD